MLSAARAGAADEARPHDDVPDHRVAVTLNPLGPIVGRWGGNVEVLPVTHHGIVMSLAYLSMSDCCVTQMDASAGGTPETSSRIHGVAGEVGYRYYTSTRGPEGLFFGPSLLVSIAGTGDDGTVSLVGGALDVGGQIMLGPLVLGAGAGVQATHASRRLPEVNDPSVWAATQSMVLPRLLLAAGVAL